jgi:hypothetical protein
MTENVEAWAAQRPLVDGGRVRLETLSRPLSEAFQRAGPEECRSAVLLACENAVSQADLRGKAIETAMSIIRDGGSLTAARLEIEDLRDRFDTEYLRLQDQDDPAAKAGALLQFRRARAAAALAFALSGESERLHEALYEAAFATDDQAGMVRSVQSVLV